MNLQILLHRLAGLCKSVESAARESSKEVFSYVFILVLLTISLMGLDGRERELLRACLAICPIMASGLPARGLLNIAFAIRGSTKYPKLPQYRIRRPVIPPYNDDSTPPHEHQFI